MCARADSDNSRFGGKRKVSIDSMSELHSSVAEIFSLTQGGPLYRLQVRFGRARGERARILHRALFAMVVAWLPLLVLSIVQGAAYGKQLQIPFLRDFAVNVRFLVALPIFILAESGIDGHWRLLVLHFLHSGLIKEPELSSFEAVIRRVTRLRDSMLPEAIIAAVAYSSFLIGSHTEVLIGSASNWHTRDSGSSSGLSLAGWWFTIISAPFFRFLLLRWVWRMFLWTLFLRQVSKLNLGLVATHTDMAAGLGFLSMGQKRFGPIVFAGGAVVASQVGNAIAYDGAALEGMKFVLIGYGVLAVLLLVAPPLVTTPTLRNAKTRALLSYGALVTSHNQSFAAKSVNGHAPRGDEILGNPDPSSLIDLGSSFQVVQQMKVVPINRSTLTILVASAALPMVPLVVLVTPADKLIRVVLKMLI
jgi:hypothetical protein